MIAERVFTAGDKTVRLQFFQPTPDGADARCAFTVLGLGREIEGYAMGVDGVQALQLALQRAHLVLLSDPDYASLRWLDRQDLDLPLPVGMTIDEVLRHSSVRNDEAHR